MFRCTILFECSATFIIENQITQMWLGHTCHTTDPSSTVQFHVWVGLGNKNTLLKVREKLWFCLNVNKHITS